MLEASDEYVLKLLGADFPGTGAVLPGEAGDTPGVEIAGGPGEYGSYSNYGTKPDGTKGFSKPGEMMKDDSGNWLEYVPGSGWQMVPSLKLAHYEPQGQVISEKRKLKSPQKILNKIPGYYDGKPAPLGFPVEPPPEMKNGMHPDLVDGKKVADRFNRLDPESAKAMPPTGNPHIDKKVKAARKKPK